MANNSISHRLEAIQSKVAETCHRVNRDPSEVRLLAVSKGQGPDKIRAAYALGLRNFAENYSQEMQAKAAELSELSIHWHFIGRLQSNKIAKIVCVVDEVQSVVSYDQALVIANKANSLRKVPFPIYLCINLEKEPSKAGVSFSELGELLDKIRKLPDIEIRGLMAIPPIGYSDTNCQGKVPEAYQTLAQARSSYGLPHLSLGMTDDIEIAIAAGSTCLRIGRGLFGART